MIYLQSMKGSSHRSGGGGGGSGLSSSNSMNNSCTSFNNSHNQNSSIHFYARKTARSIESSDDNSGGGGGDCDIWKPIRKLNLINSSYTRDAPHDDDDDTADDKEGEAGDFKCSPGNNTTTISNACNSNSIITLNVSGMHFQMRESLLARHKTTLLGDPKQRRQFFDPDRDEYFLDRHRPTFEAIFHYYQYGGKLSRPPQVPEDIFLSEIEYFQLEPEVILRYKREEGYPTEKILLPKDARKRYLWMLFEYPETSNLVFAFAIVSVLLTVLSIVLFCMETIPKYSNSHCVGRDDSPNFTDPFFILETVCTLWFTVEVLIRFYSSPKKSLYLKDFKNYVDIAAIVPYYITLINVLISFSCHGAKTSASLSFLRVIRLIRIFKLTKHSAGLQILLMTFRASIGGLTLFLVAFMVCVLVFSSIIYYVEMGAANTEIESIPDAFWWAVITMCTVGYGDIVPKGLIGRMVGCVCAVSGVLTLAIPVPIITENFNKFYAHKTRKTKLYS